MNENIKTVNGHRIKQNGYSHAKADARKNKLRFQAIARNTAYAAATPTARLESLDARDLEARRERARLYPILHNVVLV